MHLRIKADKGTDPVLEGGSRALQGAMMEMAVRIRLTSAKGSAGTGPLWPEGSGASHRGVRTGAATAWASEMR